MALNSPALQDLFSILTRACDLEARVARRLSNRGGDDSQSAEKQELNLPSSDSRDQAFTRVHQRLTATVIRPLRDALAGEPLAAQLVSTPTDLAEGDASETLSDRELDDVVWALAKDATKALLNDPGPVPAKAKEATAGLQHLTCELAAISDENHNSPAKRLEELKSLQAALPSDIQAERNGPYLVTNGESLLNWLGERIPVRPLTALCRCGQSATKPYCDGTHATINFTDSKDPKRGPDRRDTYLGQQVTILDNRGTCAHSGFCTDRLSSVFRLKQEPFVAPSGARMDDIIRAVRACPSGALSLAIKGQDLEDRDQVDDVRPQSIEVSKDGPYRITGGFALSDSDGHAMPFNVGGSHAL